MFNSRAGLTERDVADDFPLLRHIFEAVPFRRVDEPRAPIKSLV